jgi:TRAP-type mannitol/chloroaromatic compound transport system substrate-binding protein
VPALERGVIDGAEFNNPSSDSVLGFADVSKNYMLQSYHQAGETFELIFNKTKYDVLPADLKSIVKYAAEAASADMSWKALDRYSKDLEALKGRGVTVTKTPEAVLKAQLDAWDKVIAEFSKDPFFKKVIDSQRAWVQRTYAYERINEPSRDMAYDHFFKVP